MSVILMFEINTTRSSKIKSVNDADLIVATHGCLVI